MPNARPINAEHSINEVVFVIEFTRELDPNQIAKLAELEQKLKDDLPKMEKATAFGFQISDDQVVNKEIPSRLAGINFKHFAADGNFDWSLRAERNFIAVSCLDYTRWKNVWPRAKGYLSLAAEAIMGPDCPAHSVALQYIDRFVFDGRVQEYSLDEILNSDSKYLPANVYSVGAFWHVHQGWFKHGKNLPRILNRVNIDVADANGDHITTIDHQCIAQYINEPLTNSSKLFDRDIGESDQTEIDTIFNELHDNNKELLCDLLSEPMQKKINLMCK